MKPYRLESEMLMERSAIVRLANAGLWEWLMGEEKPAYAVESGVATICIDGPISQKGGPWWQGYDTIQQTFEAALADEAVSSVILKINSPGGVCSGCFTAVRAMTASKARSGKRVFAYADESAYSAAYALACVADQIYMPAEGGVGSIGVIGSLEDWTGFNERVGIKVAVVVSGSHKADGHPDVPLKPDVIARYQARVDQLAESFIGFVAMSRGITPASIVKLEAACVYGAQAEISNLVDGVESFDFVVNLARKPSTTNGKNSMSNQTKPDIATQPYTPTAQDRRAFKVHGMNAEAQALFVERRTEEIKEAAKVRAEAQTDRAHAASDNFDAYDEEQIEMLGGTEAARSQYLANRKALAKGSKVA